MNERTAELLASVPVGTEDDFNSFCQVVRYVESKRSVLKVEIEAVMNDKALSEAQKKELLAPMFEKDETLGRIYHNASQVYFRK